jgi:uncharacterized membrane protein YphA (DoxX/SURF4 family)
MTVLRRVSGLALVADSSERQVYGQGVQGEESMNVMNVVLWVLQVLLTLQFLFHGWIFTFPPAEMVDVMNAAFAPAPRVFIGVAELLAAVGLVLPSVTRILPWLTPLSAAGLMIVTVSATVYHLSRGELGNAIYTAVLLVLVTVVAYMRWKVKPILPRDSVERPREMAG